MFIFIYINVYFIFWDTFSVSYVGKLLKSNVIVDIIVV